MVDLAQKTLINVHLGASSGESFIIEIVETNFSFQIDCETNWAMFSRG